ncbi:bone morphogenetic protein 10-like [Patiria miniata]|uniref:TGF-beta family profile domain-containing protein n=1 Tax=Patiria miniata TaxID=46514 RepID=A0A914ADU5_PATMI|nr:bone morphogenetic protein 10-like [Patiria miniata]
METVALLANLLLTMYAVEVTNSAAIQADVDPSMLSSNYLKPATQVEVLSYRVNKVKSDSRSNGQIILDREHRDEFNEVLDSFLGGNPVKYQDRDEVHQEDLLTGLQETDKTSIKFLGKEDSSNTDFPSSVQNVPTYMMDLYNAFSKDRYVHPDAEIIRSFLNEGSSDLDDSSCFGSVTSLEHGVTGDHYLLFNITMPSHETVVMAQLRIFIKVAYGNTHYGGIARIILSHDLEVGTKLLTSRVIYRQTDGWESFDLTSIVRLIVSQSKVSKNPSDVWPVASQSLCLGIHLQPLIQIDGRSYLDVDISNVIEFEPLLVVYSDNYEKLQHMGYLKRQEMLARDRIHSDKAGLAITSNSATIVRSKRDAMRHHRLCKRRPMQVIFKDIGWDDWVIAPTHYQAFKCSGKCVFPLTDHWSPTVHSIIQTLAHEYDPVGVDNPCCVPTQLGPISMLYLDENNVLTYKYRYEGMVVKKCGCH